MGTWQPSDEPLEVEELRFGSWAGPGSGPGAGPPTGPGDGWETSGPGDDEPTPFERAVAWLRAHVRPLAIGAGAVAAALLVASIVTGPDGNPGAATETTATVPPSTTQPRPVTSRPPRTTTTSTPTGDGGIGGTAADLDWRMALADTPAGYELITVELVDDLLYAEPPTLLFAPLGASAASGPWLLVTAADRDMGLQYQYTFNRPPTDLAIGGYPAQAGSATGGFDQLVVRRETATMIVLSRGLDTATVGAIAEAVSFDDEVIDVPGSALPAGFLPIDATSLDMWTGGWQPGVRSQIGLISADPGPMISIAARPTRPGPTPDAAARFFLDDLHYVTVGGHRGVAGVQGFDRYFVGMRLVVWHDGERELILSAPASMSLGQALEVAGNVITAGDERWSDELWDEAYSDAAECCDSFPPDAEDSSVTGFPALAAPDDGRWLLDLYPSRAALGWDVLNDRTRIGGAMDLRAPTLDVAPSYITAFDDAIPYVGAFALLDRSQAGAVLRLTTNGSSPQSVEIALRPVDGSDPLAPFIAAGALLPWTDGGFVARVIAPDGTVILTQSDADLP